MDAMKNKPAQKKADWTRYRMCENEIEDVMKKYDLNRAECIAIVTIIQHRLAGIFTPYPEAHRWHRIDPHG